MIDGIINLNKPVGITSAKALYRIRRLVGERKSGHAGTLDPAASGVLLICQGRATKLVERIMDLPKVYRAAARLDLTSDTFDSDAEVRGVDVTDPPTGEDVTRALSGFEGEILQVPPTISAVKVGGVRAYRRARSGETIVLQPRKAQVHWIRLESYEWPAVNFEMCCGRGTYVRAIIRDLGVQLSTGGCLTSLVRTSVGPFGLDNAWTFDSIEASDRCAPILPIERVEALLSKSKASTIQSL